MQGLRRQTLLIEEAQFVFLAIPESTSHLAASWILENSLIIFPVSKSIIETALLFFEAAAFALFLAFSWACSGFFSLHSLSEDLRFSFALGLVRDLINFSCQTLCFSGLSKAHFSSFSCRFFWTSEDLIFSRFFFLASAYSSGLSRFHFLIRSLVGFSHLGQKWRKKQVEEATKPL